MTQGSCTALAETRRQGGCVALAAGLLYACGMSGAGAEDLGHLDQKDLLELVARGHGYLAFELAFEHGDEMFETTYTAEYGVGANVADGIKFTRLPRVDLNGPGEWATHVPERATGPNAAACTGCHNTPTEDGAGGNEVNVVRDPHRTGDIKSFIVRNTPHLFGAGAVQRLAEEMTGELQVQRQRAKEAACATGRAQSAPLQAKGIEFGIIAAIPVASAPCEVDFDTSGVEGVDADLVIRPFRWKGADLNLRAFVREAANNEIGMQAVELVGPDVDGDHDGVVDELTVGDITALELYVAAQPRPVSTLELAELGLIEPLSAGERGAIRRGEALFSSMGCAECHRPALTVDEPTFSTPSQSPSYREAMFPGGLDPLAEGLDPATPVSYDLTRELPDNVVVTPSGETFELGVFTTNDHGGALIPLYSDLKRHDMGPELADSVDEIGTGPSVWLTPELWGVGSTAPYLHDGRATTLDEAIRAHGGEAKRSRVAYERSSEANRAQLIAFLESLMLFRVPEDEVD